MSIKPRVNQSPTRGRPAAIIALHFWRDLILYLLAAIAAALLYRLWQYSPVTFLFAVGVAACLITYRWLGRDAHKGQNHDT